MDNRAAYAETGEFYDKHKKKIEKHIKSEGFRDFIKSYDIDTNSFECGMLDWYCKMMSPVYSGMIGNIQATYKSLNSITIDPDSIVKHKNFTQYKNAFSKLSKTMLAIFLAWNIMKLVAIRFADASDGYVALNHKYVLVFTAAILLGIYDDLFTWILQIQESAVKDIYGATKIKFEDIALMVFIKGGVHGLFTAFITFLAFIVFTIVFMYRFVLFGLMYVVGVLAIPTMVNDEFNYFPTWIRTIANNVVTFAMQLITFLLGYKSLIFDYDYDMGASFTVAIAFFILSLAVPSLLGQFGASTGTVRTMSTIAKYAITRR
ncbi:MAG TPA: conjugal transfer protein TrbL family protein [Metabacillus sp.]|nr:conjugal transfer protein TrbL family protein [Metabacillus sp.]